MERKGVDNRIEQNRIEWKRALYISKASTILFQFSRETKVDALGGVVKNVGKPLH